MIVFGSLFAKVYRIWRIVQGAEKIKRVVITDVLLSLLLYFQETLL